MLFCMAEQIWLFSNQFQMQDLILFLKHFKNDVTLHLVNMPAFHDYCYEWRIYNSKEQKSDDTSCLQC